MTEITEEHEKQNVVDHGVSVPVAYTSELEEPLNLTEEQRQKIEKAQQS